MPGQLDNIKGKDGELVLFQNIDESLDLQQQLDELYRRATLADKKLGSFMREVIKKFPGVKGARHAPLKAREKAEEKVTKRGKDVNQLKDIARATIEFQKHEDMFAAREYIRNHEYFTKIKHVEGALKDRYTTGATDVGYMDVKFFLLVPIDDGEHLVELQLNVMHALMGKKIAHGFYELTRLGGADWSPDNPESKIVIEAEDAADLGLKLRTEYVACKSKGTFNAEGLSRVGKMVDKEFFNNHGRTLGHKVILNNRSPSEKKLSRDLSQLCCDIYAYYDKLSKHQLTGTAKDIHAT